MSERTEQIAHHLAYLVKEVGIKESVRFLNEIAGKEVEAAISAEIPTVRELMECGYSWLEARPKHADLVYEWREEHGMLKSGPLNTVEAERAKTRAWAAMPPA